MAVIKGSRERPEKILLAMFALTDGQAKLLKYEDIVVKAFELFPDEFALRGYPQYPDSSDLHKPLYGPLKRLGLVRAVHKTFGLTEKGLEYAKRLRGAAGNRLDEKRDPNRLSRDVEQEVERMLSSEAAKFFSGGQAEKIIDTDFFSFLGCTVRTDRNDFIGRVRTVEEAIGTAMKLKLPSKEHAKLLLDVWACLKGKFQGIIDRKKEQR